MYRYLSEAIGTFVLVFAGTGAIIINDISAGEVTHVGISLTFGLVVTTLIYALGDISGAHLNPAVSMGLWMDGRFPGRRIVPYVLSQTTGAFLASLLLSVLFHHNTLGATLPTVPDMPAFVMEAVLTFFLMFVILNVTGHDKDSKAIAGAAVGAVVCLDALFGGPVTGASMNPARSLAPAVISGKISGLWIYIFAPVTGSAIAVILHKLMMGSMRKGNER